MTTYVTLAELCGASKPECGWLGVLSTAVLRLGLRLWDVMLIFQMAQHGSRFQLKDMNKQIDAAVLLLSVWT